MDRMPPKFELGDVTLRALCDGLYRLDGGSMFGIVPKVMWEKVNPPDEMNRISMSLNMLYVHKNGKHILIEGGIGDKWDEKLTKIYAIDKSVNIDDELGRIGLTAEDIDYVLLTHLHFDHCGSISKYDKKGKLVPRFKNATHFVHEVEWEDASHPHARNRASYIEDNYLPVYKAGLFEFWYKMEEWYDIVEGIEGLLIGGHTPGLSMYSIKSSDEKMQAVYIGDMVPTGGHMPAPWVMGYDLDPTRALELKEYWLAEWEKDRTLVCFTHDCNYPWAYVGRDEKGHFEARPMDEGWLDVFKRRSI